MAVKVVRQEKLEVSSVSSCSIVGMQTLLNLVSESKVDFENVVFVRSTATFRAPVQILLSFISVVVRDRNCPVGVLCAVSRAGYREKNQSTISCC